jgi:heparin binding hemagglutinin HbhA
MTNQTKTRIPAPLYAAAGAGDLAYEQLRKLPATLVELRGKAVANTTELRERAVARFKAANATATDLRGKATTADLDRLREVAKRNAAAVFAGAQAVYTDLVARGERVVGTGVVEAADVVNADMESTAAAEVTDGRSDVAVVTDQAAKSTAKPVKRTRPATRK